MEKSYAYFHAATGRFAQLIVQKSKNSSTQEVKCDQHAEVQLSVACTQEECQAIGLGIKMQGYMNQPGLVCTCNSGDKRAATVMDRHITSSVTLLRLDVNGSQLKVVYQNDASKGYYGNMVLDQPSCKACQRVKHNKSAPPNSELSRLTLEEFLGQLFQLCANQQELVDSLLDSVFKDGMKCDDTPCWSQVVPVPCKLDQVDTAGEPRLPRQQQEQQLEPACRSKHSSWSPIHQAALVPRITAQALVLS